MTARCAIGVDIGGTKCAAGLVDISAGRVLAQRVHPTNPERGGESVLSDVAIAVCLLQDEALRLGVEPAAVGVGVPELVSLSGQVLSDATLGWRDLPVRDELQARTRLPVRIEADVRAAAVGEARAGAGRHLESFLYVTVGTGISACLVLRGRPYAGARGLTGTFASSRALFPTDDGNLVSGPPLEQFAAGPALVARYAAAGGRPLATTSEIIELCEAGDALARELVGAAAEALGAGIAHLVNVLDPEVVVIGGGLGLVGGRWRDSLEQAVWTHVWSEHHGDIPVLSAELGVDAGVVGAALAAVSQ